MYSTNVSKPTNLQSNSNLLTLHRFTKDTLNVTNYRLISVTNAFSKIFDITLHAQISAHLEGEQILNPLQFGIRPQYSTHDSSLIFNRIFGSFPL